MQFAHARFKGEPRLLFALFPPPSDGLVPNLFLVRVLRQERPFRLDRRGIVRRDHVVPPRRRRGHHLRVFEHFVALLDLGQPNAINGCVPAGFDDDRRQDHAFFAQQLIEAVDGVQPRRIRLDLGVLLAGFGGQGGLAADLQAGLAQGALAERGVLRRRGVDRGPPPLQLAQRGHGGIRVALDGRGFRWWAGDGDCRGRRVPIPVRRQHAGCRQHAGGENLHVFSRHDGIAPAASFAPRRCPARPDLAPASSHRATR